MASMKFVVVPVILVLGCIVASTQRAEGAVTCNQVVNSLYPCVSYVMQGGSVPPECCNGVRTLYGEAQTAADRQGVCRCLKSAVGGMSYSAYSLNNAASLPAKCGVNLPYKINPSTNCDSIN